MNKLITVVRTLILREATKASVRNFGQRTSIKLTELLISNETRNIVYKCCMEINTWDCERRYSIAVLLLSYLKSFPPTKEVLLLLREQYLQFIDTTCETSINAIYLKLLQVIERQLQYHPLIHFNEHGKANFSISLGELKNFTSTSYRPCRVYQRCKIQSVTLSNNKLTPTEIESHNTIHKEVRHYIRNVEISKLNSRKDNCIAIPPLIKSIKKESRLEENSFGHLVRNSTEMFYAQMQCYITASFSICPLAKFDEYIQTIKQFRNDYSNNNKTIESTIHIVHVILSLYLLKIPFFAHSNSFRGISISLLPLLFEWMESEYLCIRNHVYDFLINFACHVQLVDRKNVCKGLTTAIEKEVIWILLHVLHHQWVIRRENDISTWRSVLRTMLIILPPAYYKLLDFEIILELFHLPEIVNGNSEIFEVLTEMLLATLTIDTPLIQVTGLQFVLNEEKLEKININFFALLNSLLRKASTLRSQKNLLALYLSLSLRELHRRGLTQSMLKLEEENEYLQNETQHEHEELEHKDVRSAVNELSTSMNMRCNACMNYQNGFDQCKTMPLKVNKTDYNLFECFECVSLTPNKSEYTTLNRWLNAIFDFELFN